MESIEQMIKRLCPKGVEWKKISEIGTIYRGFAYSKKDFTETGTPCIHYGQIYTRYGTFANKTFTCVSKDLAKGKRLAKKGDLVMAVTSENLEDVGKCLAWLGEDDILVSNHACFIRHSLNPKYLAYFLQTSYFFKYKKKISKGVKVIDLDLNMFGDMLIPVPPLEIQSRIVEVLDKMATLTAELEAELEARKQQYEYYRNKLLTFSEIGGGIRQVTWKTLGETCTILTGGEPCGNIIKGGKSDSMHPYAIFGNGAEIYGWSDTYRVGTDAVTISSIGANTGTIYYRKGPFTPIIRLKVILPGENLSQRFLYHILKTIKIKKKKSSVPNMNANEIKSILIPVPSMEEQERIVSILDRFEALTTDLQSGLPAEIEARRQQYEYYRNKLLTFDAV